MYIIFIYADVGHTHMRIPTPLHGARAHGLIFTAHTRAAFTVHTLGPLSPRTLGPLSPHTQHPPAFTARAAFGANTRPDLDRANTGLIFSVHTRSGRFHRAHARA